MLRVIVIHSFIFLFLGGLMNISCGHLCLKNEYVKGNWVLNNNVTQQSNLCSKTSCADEAISNTSIKSMAISYYCSSIFHNRRKKPIDADESICSNYYLDQNTNSVSIPKPKCECIPNKDSRWRDKWEWVTDRCDFLYFEAVPFCRALNGRTILFVGDSLTSDTYVSLRDLIVEGGGKCENQIFFGRSDFLWISRQKRNHVFSAYAAFRKPDIIVMNAGAHLGTYNEFKDELLPNTLAMIDKVIIDLNKTVRFFWRTNYGAHENCWTFTHPIEWYNLSALHSNDPTYRMKYNWQFFQDYDRDAAGILARSNDKMRLLDVSPVYLRAEAHKANFTEGGENKTDCLHYKIPGPLDLTARIMYNMMITGEM
eukprot:gene8284-11214_t